MADKKCHVRSRQNKNYEEYKPIPNSDSYVDTPKIWINFNTTLLAKDECGCYKTNTRNAYEHYTNWIKTYNLCPKHYTEHTSNIHKQQNNKKGDTQPQQKIGKRTDQWQPEIRDSRQQRKIRKAYIQLQRDKEIRKNRNSCTDVILFLAKDNQQMISNAIKKLTLPYLKDLKDFCDKNNFTYSISHNLFRCISSCGSTTFASENHTCTCKWIVSFANIKYNRIARKTFHFNIPNKDSKGNIGSIKIEHCDCHSSGAIYKFGLKPLL